MSSGPTVPIVGLVGGVGSGKTTIANAVQARRRVVVIDGDAAGHAVLTYPSIKRRLREDFGNSIFDEQGAVDRRSLAALVFGPSPEQKEARTRLERIVHPEIRKLIQKEIDSARKQADVEAILLDAAVLFEAGWNDLCTAVVFIDTPADTRAKRVEADRGWSGRELKARESSQAEIESKRNQANFVIHNDGTLEAAVDQLEQVIARLVNNGWKASDGLTTHHSQ